MTLPNPSWDRNGAWSLVFHDGFPGTALNPYLWTPGWYGTGATGPVDASEIAAYRSANAFLPGDSYLHLRLAKVPVTTVTGSFGYSGALVSTLGKFAFAPPAAIEFRACIPPPGGPHLANWPALWTVGENWPADGENDVMEGLDGGSAACHFHSAAGQTGIYVAGSWAGWHRFGAHWETTRVTYFWDGLRVGAITTGITTAPHHIVMDHSLSAASAGPSVPCDLLVDWVRVWR